jgi:thiosulfate dehydrogenase
MNKFIILRVSFYLSLFVLVMTGCKEPAPKAAANASDTTSAFLWYPPLENTIPAGDEGELIQYGRNLVVHTSYYYGPHGIISKACNALNCQNCHLEAGTKPWGNNFSAVHSTYPKYKERIDDIENAFKKINDCFQRSLNGKAIDTNSREMRAIAAYISWLGKEVPKGIKPDGAGITKLDFLDRAADTNRGLAVYVSKCQSCHGADGMGVRSADTPIYRYPPLWGPLSYNTGASIYRLSRLAGFVKSNMPFGKANFLNPELTDEEAWDVAAYINSRPRPSMDISHDWPDISKKPADHPFGPYSDTFSETTHKYGPFTLMGKAK